MKEGVFSHFPEKEQSFWIPGPVGRLELRTLASDLPVQGVGVICHPHPLHGGTLDNKVVHTLSRAFHSIGWHAVRFNFRGVGQSDGQFGNSEGEIEDLAAVLSWVQQVASILPLSLAGFSFGAYIAAHGAIHPKCRKLCTVAPAVTHQPYDTLPTLEIPWLVIQGTEDEVIPLEAVSQWVRVQKQKEPALEYWTLPATHFFHGHLVSLREGVARFMAS